MLFKNKYLRQNALKAYVMSEKNFELLWGGDRADCELQNGKKITF